MLLSLDCHARLEYYIIICHITRRGDTCYHVCATWVPQIIGAVPGIKHGESRVTTEGVYSPNVSSIYMTASYEELIKSGKK